MTSDDRDGRLRRLLDEADDRDRRAEERDRRAEDREGPSDGHESQAGIDRYWAGLDRDAAAADRAELLDMDRESSGETDREQARES